MKHRPDYLIDSVRYEGGIDANDGQRIELRLSPLEKGGVHIEIDEFGLLTLSGDQVTTLAYCLNEILEYARTAKPLESNEVKI